MKLTGSKIFKSTNETKYPSFFENTSVIQSHLSTICEKWKQYLQAYADTTSSLFDNAELPWEDTEPAIVSTLAASITRSFKTSIVIEELGGKKGLNNGRCDLWTSIPELKMNGMPFSFYLEAKKSASKSGVGALYHYLKTDRGISRVVRDYSKGSPERFAKLSSYRDVSGRKHDHFVVGMLVVRLKYYEGVESEIETALKGTFGTRMKPTRQNSKTMGHESIKRRMFRFPTVAMAAFPDDHKRPGMLATFTVFGSTKKLMTQKAVKEPQEK